MRLNFFWFIALGLQQSSLCTIKLEKFESEPSAMIDAVCEVAMISSPFKSAVWFSKNQTHLISKILKKLNVPFVLNAIERPKSEGLETRPPNDLVIILNDASIEGVLNNTLWNANTRFLVLANDFNKMQSDFKSFWKFKVVNVFEIMENDTGKIHIYGYVPYTKGHCGSVEPVLLDKYLPSHGNFVNGGSTLNDPARIKDANQCPVNVTIVDVKPMTVFEDECGCNASSHLEGIEGNLISEIAKVLNFKATFVIALDGVGWGWIRPSPRGAVGEVFTGRSDFAVGLLAPTIERYESLDISLPYDGKECISFGVPKGAGVRTPYWITILISEFTPLTWLLILISFALMFYFFYALNRYYRKRKWFRSGSDIFLYEFSSFLGFPIDIPDYFLIRLIVMSWILWSFIITVTYKTSISSKLTVPNEDPDINTFEELIRSPLQLTGYKNMLRLLQYNDSENAIRKMLKRFKVTEFDINYALDIIAEERRIAYAGHKSTFLYYSLINPKAKGHIHVMSDCLLSYYPTVMTKKNSPFSYRVNQLVSRLTESGITKRWKSDYIYDVPNPPKSFLKLSNYHMYGVFCILCGGYALSFILFTSEIILFRYAKAVSRNAQRKFMKKNLRR